MIKVLLSGTPFQVPAMTRYVSARTRTSGGTRMSIWPTTDGYPGSALAPVP